jgi:hypothetical protein
VLVENDLSEELVENMDIITSDPIYSQIVDYANVPFQCDKCHCYGHITRDCEPPFVR